MSSICVGATLIAHADGRRNADVCSDPASRRLPRRICTGAIIFRGCRSGPRPFDPLMEAPMKYMLLIYRDEGVWTNLSLAEQQKIYEDTRVLADEVASRGQYVAGHPLHPSSSATSVRVRDGKRLVTDGPYAEAREQLGGYMIIDVKDLDEALGVAARIPLARTSTIEIRPVRDGA